MDHNENCRHFLDSLSEYIDGQLSDEICRELEGHLAECNNCRVVIDTLRKTISLYHTTLSSTELPEEVRQRLFLRLDLNDFLLANTEEVTFPPGVHLNEMYISDSEISYEPIMPFLSLKDSVEKVEFKSGDLCPECGTGMLDYDGMLNLVCPQCGYTLSGCFT